jgi:hypothetical protein
MLPSQTLEGWKIQDEQPLRSQDLIALLESSLGTDSHLTEHIEADDDIDRLSAYGHSVHRGLKQSPQPTLARVGQRLRLDIKPHVAHLRKSALDGPVTPSGAAP